MRFSVGYKIAASLVGIVGACNVAQGATDQEKILSHFRNYGRSSINSLRLEGSVEGANYSVAGARRSTEVVFDVSLEGNAIQLHFGNEQFPNIDLRSITEGMDIDNSPHSLSFDVKYGEPLDCFVDDDGRSLLAVSINSDGLVSVSRLATHGCQVTWHEVHMVRTGSSTFSAAPAPGRAN